MKAKGNLNPERLDEFVSDVRAGIADADLSEKYGMYGRTLVLHKIAARDYLDQLEERSGEGSSRKISAKQLLGDLRSGLDNDELMLKYELSPRQLQKAFRQIIGAKLMTPLELANRLSVTRSQITEAFREVQEAMKVLE